MSPAFLSYNHLLSFLIKEEQTISVPKSEAVSKTQQRSGGGFPKKTTPTGVVFTLAARFGLLALRQIYCRVSFQTSAPMTP